MYLSKMNLKKQKHLIQFDSGQDDDTQNYLVFQKTYRYFKTVSNTNDHILSWKSKGFPDESIKPPSTSTNILNPLLDYVGTKTKL